MPLFVLSHYFQRNSDFKISDVLFKFWTHFLSFRTKISDTLLKHAYGKFTPTKCELALSKISENGSFTAPLTFYRCTDEKMRNEIYLRFFLSFFCSENKQTVFLSGDPLKKNDFWAKPNPNSSYMMYAGLKYVGWLRPRTEKYFNVLHCTVRISEGSKFSTVLYLDTTFVQSYSQSTSHRGHSTKFLTTF